MASGVLLMPVRGSTGPVHRGPPPFMCGSDGTIWVLSTAGSFIHVAPTVCQALGLQLGVQQGTNQRLRTLWGETDNRPKKKKPKKVHLMYIRKLEMAGKRENTGQVRGLGVQMRWGLCEGNQKRLWPLCLWPSGRWEATWTHSTGWGGGRCVSTCCSSSLGGKEVPETSPRPEGQHHLHGGGGSVGVDREGDRLSC